MKLTEEQSEIVADNHNLIYGYVRDFNLNLDECYGDLAIALCKAVIAHNPHKGSLSNLFYRIANNTLIKRYKFNNVEKRRDTDTLSLNYEYGGDTCESYTLENIAIREDDYVPDEIIDMNERYEFLFNHRHGLIVKLRYLGYTQEDIASKLFVSQQYISEVLQSIRRDYDDEFGQ